MHKVASRMFKRIKAKYKTGMLANSYIMTTLPLRGAGDPLRMYRYGRGLYPLDRKPSPLGECPILHKVFLDTHPDSTARVTVHSVESQETEREIPRPRDVRGRCGLNFYLKPPLNQRLAVLAVVSSF